MVAIVSGNSLGLNLTSSGVLGSAGVYGNPTTGQGGEQVYVNAATGNLVMQQLQDQLVGTGLDVTSVLTYNSLGLANDDNGDKFSIGKVPVQLALTAGIVNTAGSILTRTAFDGAQAIFTWDSANSRYIAVNGAGAFDTITRSGSTYTWTDGASQQKETYDASTGNLLTRSDAAGNTITFGYTGGLLTSVTDANGETVTYVYNGTLLTQINAPTSNGVQPVVSYLYDGSNRLKSVTVDLTPDGSTADGKVYTTSFTYDGASNRVQTVSQTDGTSLTFAYDASNRVYTITDALSNVTTFNYDTANHKTSVTANGQTAVYGYDATSGLLTTVTAPAVNGVSALSQYNYNANGELRSFLDGDGRTTTYGYDAAGNQVTVQDNAGNLTTRTYDAQNRLVTETASMAPALDLTTRYVYSADGKGLLRYKITPDGRVTEYGYNAQGQVTSSQEYVVAVYPLSGLSASTVPTEATMNTWRASQNLALTKRTDIGRDSRQQVSSTVTYAATAADGTGVASTASSTTFVYDPAGRLLQTIKPGSATTTYVYDGLGRVTSSTDPLHRTTTTSYADAAGTVTVTYANQLITTSSFDKDGRLTSTTQTYSSNALAKNTVDYDGLGHVLRTTDLTNVSTWYLYDADGRKVATVDGTGALTQYVYDNAGQVTETIAYANRVNMALLVDGNGKPNNPPLSSVLPTFNATTDHRNWIVYDADGRVSQTIGSTGTVTQYAYDGESRVTSICVFATAIDVSTLGSAPTFQSVTASTADRTSRNFYDGDGHLVGALDANNYLTAYQYDAAGQQTVAIRYATKSPAATAQGTLTQLIPASAPGDERMVSLYDLEGRLTGHVDALGYLTQTVYNPRGTVDHVTRYATAVGTSVAAGTSVDTIKPVATAADTTTSYVYDADDRVTTKTDPLGIITTYTYDSNTDVLISSTTGASRTDAATTQTRYDALGRAVATLDGVGSALITAGMTQAQIDAVWAQHAVTTTYDLAGRRASTKDALGNITLYFYDGDGQLRYTVDPLNNVKELRYDSFGNVTTTISYAKAISPAGIGAGGLVTAALTSAVTVVANAATDSTSSRTYDTAGHLVLSVDPTGAVTRYAYDAMGRVTLVVDPAGAATGYTYDANGNVTQVRQYATPLPTGGAMNVAHLANGDYVSRGLGTFKAGDTVTATVEFKGAPGTQAAMFVGNAIGANAYDNSTSLKVACDGTWQTITLTLTLTADRTLQVYLYGDSFNSTHVPGAAVQYDNLSITSSQTGVVLTDSFDNVDSERAAWGNPGSWMAQAASSLADAGTGAKLQALAMAIADPTRDRVTRTLYDADGRATFTVDPMGAVTGYTYDADGNVTQKRDYANTVPSGAVALVNYAGGTNSSITSPMGTFNIGDVVTATVRFKAAPGVGGKLYLGDGSTADSVSTLIEGTGGWVTLTLTHTMTKTAAMQLFLYGNRDGTANRPPAAGDLVLYDNLSVSSAQQGVVTSQTFDTIPLGTGIGQWTVSGSMNQVYVTPADAGTDAQLQSLVNSLADPNRDRVTRKAYDANGRVTLVIDPAGAATGYTYDADGNVTQQRQYATPLPTGGAMNLTYTASGDNASHSLGTFKAGDTVTATVEFKGAPGTQASMFLGNAIGANAYDNSTSLKVSCDGTWQTITLTLTLTADRTLQVYLYGDTFNSTHIAGAAVQYDNLSVTSAKTGVVLTDSFDNVESERAAWGSPGAWMSQASNSLADAGTGAKLQALAAAISDPTRDRVTRNAYDANGRVTLTVDPKGAATGYTYDADGNVTQVRQYVTPLPSGGAMNVPHLADGDYVSRGLGNFKAGDTVTATVEFKGAPGTQASMFIGNAIGANAYDNSTSLKVSCDGTWQTITLTLTLTADRTLQVYLYGDSFNSTHIPGAAVQYDNLSITSSQTGVVLADSFDNVDSERAAWGNPGDWMTQTWNSLADVGTGAQLQALAAAVADPARDRVTRNAYDANGRVTLTVDPKGAATGYTYDADGNVTQVRQYVTPLPSGGAMNVPHLANGDYVSRSLGNFKAGDTVTATVEFKGAPGTQAAMFIGNAIGANANDNSTSLKVSCDGTWQTITLTLTLTADRTLQVYLYGDSFNSTHIPGAAVQYDNLSITSSQTGVVLTDSFDNVDSERAAWGNPGAWMTQTWNSLADVGTGAQLQALAAAVADPARDRVTRNAYDANGRVTLTVDPKGAATGYTYDADGHVTQVRQYATPLPSGGAMNVPHLANGDYVSRGLGNFKAGDTVTATVEFKGAPGTQAAMFIGNAIGANAYDNSTSLKVACDGTWQTITLTLTLTADRTLQVYLYGDSFNSTHIPGAAVQYDNLSITSSQTGVVLADSFDNVDSERAAWGNPGAWMTQTWNSLADAGTGAQLQALAAAVADPTRDRITNNEYNVDGQLVWSADSLGHATRTVYDTAGRPIYVIAADGAVTRTDYDADGRVARTTTFANTLSAATLASLPHAAAASQFASLIVARPGSDAVLAYQYDSFGRARFTMDGTGAITEKRYDADGNVVDSIAYANKIDPSTWRADAPPSIVADVAHDRHVHASYDAFGNVVAQSDGTGAVVANTYDADGHLTDRISYANRIALGSWTSGAQPAVTADPSRDIHERFVYTAQGQLSYSADGTGGVCAYVYDADGNLTQKTLLATAAVAGQGLNSVASSPNDRTERFSYDAFGHQVWHADATGALDYTGYDADGRVTQTVRYAQPVTAGLPIGTAPLATTAGDRVATTYYSAFGQVIYTVDALNRVALNKYDQAGRLLSTTRYAGAIAAGSVPSAPTVPIDTVNDQTTSYQYDAAGRVAQRTDATGGVQSFTYDGLGNKLTLTDEKNQIWTWTYDADGRELTQTSPVVSVTTNSVNGSGDLADSSVNAGIVTAMTYDGVGNLTQRIDAYGRTDARTTVYGYDAAGHQVSVQGPAVNKYAYDVTAAAADKTYRGTLLSTSAPVSRTFYDAFGNVVATVDSLNAITYTTYDQANRVAYTVDQLGYVIGNSRDAFGEVLTQTKYGAQTALIGAVPTSAANAPASIAVTSAVNALSHTSDRVMSLTYDAVGRAKSQTGMAGYFSNAASGFSSNLAETSATPTTVYQYDAFGDLVLSQQMVNQGQGLWASTYHYFDQGGQETDTVDAMGFQTHRSFDTFGNVAQTIEYANAKTGAWSLASAGTTPSVSANDRTTTDVFDRLNRKTSETRTLDYSANDNGVITGHTVTTSWGYDAQGHVTRTTDATGATTYQSYDALGRLRATIAPARSSTVDGSTVTPVTEYGYDAFGDATMVTQRFNSASGVSEFTGAWTSGGANGYTVSTNANDRVTRTAYDGGGRAIQVDDPMASITSFHNTFNEYDANGRLVYTYHYDAGNDGARYTVDQGIQYDARGQMTLSSHSGGTLGASLEAISNLKYNAFGEVTDRGTDGSYSEHSFYDNNGNLWLTNAGSGVYTAYVYDLQGHVTGQMTSQGAGHGNVDISSATSIGSIASQAAGLRVTNSVHDLDGNVLRIDSPTRNTVDAGVTTRVANSGWSGMTSGSVSTPNALTIGFNALAVLGSGQVQFTISYKDTHNTAQTATIVDDSANTSSPYLASWLPASNAGVSSITSVKIAKKDVNGTWQTVSTLTSANASLTQIEIDAPDDPRATVSFTYTKSGGSPVTASLINYGNAYSFDTSTLSAGSYTYSTTITSVNGSVSAPRTGSFTVGSGSTVNGTTVTTQVTPSVFQTFDRWGNLLSSSDPRNAAWLTTYNYNSNNQVTAQRSPGLNPTLNFYDAVGRAVASQDGNGNITGQKYDQAGHVVETDAHSDANTLVKTVTRYDILGRAVQTVSADGFNANGTAVSNVADFTTQNTYDALDDLLSVQHGVGAGNVQVYSQIAQNSTARNLVQSYTYDADGHRLTSWDGTVSSSDGTTAIKTLYAYDAAGHLVKTTLPATTGTGALAAADITYAYDDNGHLKAETDANGKQATWTYDYFGQQVLAHTDFGGDVVSDTYDNAGDLTAQTSRTSANAALQNLSYAYDAAGNQTQIYDATLNEQTTYAYDQANRHVLETVSVGSVVYQDNHLAYDAAGRLMDSADDSVHVSFQYDNAGNRTFIGTHVLLDGATNLGTTEVDNASDGSSTQYFSYDGLNRQLHVSWTSATSIGVKGHTLTYDADGNRLSDTFSGNALSVTYDASNVPTFTAVNGIATETYTYDADDRLSQVFYGVNNSGSTQQILIDERHYDSASRLLSSGGAGPFGMLDQLNKVDPAHGLVGDALDINPRSYLYDERSEVTSVATYATLQPGMAYSNNAMTYTYDEAGNKIGTVLSTQSMDAASYVRTFVDTTTIHYAVRDSYIETDEGSAETSTLMLQGSPSTKRSVTASYSTTTANDANGFATKVANVMNTSSGTIDMTGTSDLVNDAQGRVLSSTLELIGSKRERNVIVDGQEVGQYGVANDAVTGNKQVSNFSFSYRSLEDQSMTSSTSVMVAKGAESLADVAGSVYGDRELWRRIAAANGYSGNSTVQAGQRIVLAGNSGGSHNDASTFAVYQPSTVIQTQSPYGKADTGTMTSGGTLSNPMGMSDQEQSDYFRDVYGKAHQGPYMYDHGGGGGILHVSNTDASDLENGPSGDDPDPSTPNSAQQDFRSSEIRAEPTIDTSSAKQPINTVQSLGVTANITSDHSVTESYSGLVLQGVQVTGNVNISTSGGLSYGTFAAWQPALGNATSATSATSVDQGQTFSQNRAANEAKYAWLYSSTQSQPSGSSDDWTFSDETAMRTEQAQLKQARLGYGPSFDLAGGQEFRTGDNTNAYETYAVGTTPAGETQITQTHHLGLLDPIDSFLASSAHWLSDEAPGSVEDSGVEAAGSGNHLLAGFQAFMYTPTKTLGLVLGGLASIPRLLTNNDAVPSIIHALSNPGATIGAVASSFGSQSLQDKTALGLSLLTPGGFSKVSSLAGDIPRVGRFLGADMGWSSSTGVTLTTADGAIYGSLPASRGVRMTSGPIGSQVGAIDLGAFGQIGQVGARSSGRVPVQFGDVMTYGQSKAGEVVGDMLTGDHIPSYAAIRQYVEGVLGDELTDEQATALRNNTNTVIVPQDLHAAGRTYFGANTPEQIAADKLDLTGAALKDQAVHLENAASLGYNPVTLQSSFERLNQMNRQLFSELSTPQSVAQYFKNFGVD